MKKTDLIDDMIDMSRFVYAFHSLRNVVRKNQGRKLTKPCFLACGEVTNVAFVEPNLILTQLGGETLDGITDTDGKTFRSSKHRQMKYAIEPAHIKSFIEKNRTLLKDKGGYFELDEELMEEDEPFEFELIVKEQLEESKLKIVDYDDRFSESDGGLVYGVIVNLTQKRITVVFRGTIGLTDILIDRDFRLNHESMFETEDHISVPGGKPATHNGFTGYLFSNREEDSTERPYIDRILECVEEEFAHNPNVKGKGFKLYVTGHSLGGALANMFAFRVAQLKSMGHESVKDLPNRVSAFTFAAPCVGNHDYNKEFQFLEQKGFLRHFRFSNEGDIVPSNNFPAPFEWMIKGNSKDYTQNGVNLHLMSDKHLDTTYLNTKEFGTQFSMASPGFHSVLEYDRRLELECNNDVLSDIKLDDIYQKAGDFTG